MARLPSGDIICPTPGCNTKLGKLVAGRVVLEHAKRRYTFRFKDELECECDRCHQPLILTNAKVPIAVQLTDMMLFHALVQSLPDAVYTIDAGGIITSWNLGAERLYGWAAGEVIGRPMGILAVPANREDEPRALLGRILAGETIREYHGVRAHKDGRHLEVALNFTPLRDAAGLVLGATITATPEGQVLPAGLLFPGEPQGRELSA